MTHKQIPRTFHRAWFGGPIPEHLDVYGQTWLEQNPGWSLRTWTDTDLPPMRNRALFDAAEQIAGRHVGQLKADIARLEILWLHGGIWIDCDFEARKPISTLIVDVSLFAAREDDYWINTAILGATPEHPLIDLAIRGLPTSIAIHQGLGIRPNAYSGPQYFTRLFDKLLADEHHDPSASDRIAIYPSALFYPYRWNQLERRGETFPDAYAIHHWNNQRRMRGKP